MISLLEKLAEIIPARFVPSGLRMAYASVALAGFVSAACNSGPSRQEIITAMATPTAGIERVIATPYTPVKAQF
ncbi:hypothetical protein J4475_04095 [Candidatus Woesearchaeota archaeon]|nr:hypothetical protein [Candidatus Woesearchaeota archaeon]